MSRKSVRAACAFSLLLAGCTQPQAIVELKGQNVYAKSGTQEHQSKSYANYAPAPRVFQHTPPSFANQTVATGPTQQTAGVQSIGVAELAPPSQQAEPAAANVNQWTDKPREQVSQWTVAEEKPVVENASLKPSAKGEPVQLITESKRGDFIWPVNSKKIATAYGKKGAGKADDGIRIASGEGEPVWAVADGEVTSVQEEFSGYGNMVMVKHANGRTTTYGHLSQSTVDKYDRVKQGDIIGYVGSTGSVKSPQLYFAVHDGKTPVDPQQFMSRSVAGL